MKDQDDARALRISVTQKCTDYFTQRSQKELVFPDNLFNGFDADLTNDVFKGLTRLSKNIEMISNDWIGQ